MAEYTPTIYRDHIYKSGDGHLFKIIDIQLSGGLERPVVLAVDDNGRPVPNAVEQRPTITKWNNAGYTDITDTFRSSAQSQAQTQDSNAFEFVIDEDGNLKILRNGVEIKRFNVRGPRGAAGADGTPGVDGAPGSEGKRGSDGQPGRDGAPGIQGPQGIPGPTGDTWVPRITEDGQFLFFVNSSGQETEKFPIKGPKGDAGSEGIQGKPGPVGPVFIPQINADGELSWSNNGDGLNNPTPVNIKGEKGEKGDAGVIFTPVVRDGVLYWTNNQGLPNPTPVRISGPKGDVGQEGRVGLSAYEVWLSQGNRGTEKDFLNSLRGEKGSPFVDEHPEFSFMDLEDFECPIQRINTTLLTSTGVASKSPEDIIEERVQEIAHLREEGQRMKEEKKTNWFKEFTWWCAGADKPLLRMCPGEHSKYMGIGTVILFTALMAWFSSFIAMKLVFVNDSEPIYWAAILFATFWAAMIFFLDRFITNTMYSDGKVTISKEEFVGGLPRIVIAIFLGIVISAPLEIQIFQSAITQDIDKQYYSELERYINDNAERRVDDAYEKEERRLNDFREQFIHTQNLTGEQIKNMTNERKGLEQYVSWGEKRDSTGRTLRASGSGLSGESKRKLNDWDKENGKHLSRLNAKYSALNDSIMKLDSRLLNLYANRTQLLDREKEVLAQEFKNDFDRGLSRNLSTLHKLAMNGYDDWVSSKPRSSQWLYRLITLWGLLWYLLYSPEGLIMLLFILIDISPVLYKMMLADGKYDNYLHQDKLLAQDKIRLSLAHMLKKLDEGELKRVAPFVVGDVYSKMAGDTFVFKTEAEYLEELHEYNAALDKREKIIWPFKLFVPIPQNPTPPVISFAGQGNVLDDELNQANKAVFDEVLEIKKNIILAAYRKWGKEMRFHRNNDPDDGSISPEFDDVRDSSNGEAGDCIRTEIPETDA